MKSTTKTTHTKTITTSHTTSEINTKKVGLAQSRTSFTQSFRSKETKTLKSQKVFTGIRLIDLSETGYVLLLLSDSVGYHFHSKDILHKATNAKGQFTLEIQQGATYSEIELSMYTGDDSNKVTRVNSITRPSEPNTTTNDVELRKVVEYWKMTNGGCRLGDDVKDNCAHYLSDAFIRAGYKELRRVESEKLKFEGKNMFTAWCDFISTPNKRNDNARPVRANDMRRWFKTKKVLFQAEVPSNCGCWVAFFRKTTSDESQSHVFIYDSNTKVDYGTGQSNKGNYWQWEVKEFYQW